jgi:hypothetical protein
MSLDVGVGLILFVPTRAMRFERSAALQDPNLRGVYTLSDERMARAFVALEPSFGGRWEF